MSGFEQLEAGLTEVSNLLSLDPSARSTLPPDGGDSATEKNADTGATIRRAAVVLLVSHFEGYLKSIGEDLVDVLDTGEIQAKDLPLGIKEAHVIPQMEAVVSCGNTQQRWVLMKKLDTVASLWRPDAKPPRGTLRSGIATRLITNADSDCISNLFDLFGEVNDVCAGDIDIPIDGDLPECHNIRDRLGDLVKCRNDISHGNPDRRPTAEDLARYLCFVRHFAMRLNRKAKALAAQFEPELP